MLSEYLKENCEVQLHYNENNNKIHFVKLNKNEIIFNHQIPLQNLKFGLSVTCIFKYDEIFMSNILKFCIYFSISYFSFALMSLESASIS